MHPAGGYAHQDIAGNDAPAVQQPAPLHNPDHKAGQIKIGVGINARQLRRFAANQRAAGFPAAPDDAPHQHLQPVFVKGGERNIVQKEQGTRAFRQNVVDIQRHQVLPHAFKMPDLGGDFQLGAYAVGAGDQHRLRKPGQGEQAGETAAAVQRLRAVGQRRKGFDAVFQPVQRVQRHAGGGVSPGTGCGSSGGHGSAAPGWPGRLVGSPARFPARSNIVFVKSSCTGTG